MASEHRFVISVRIIGAVQRRTPKLKVSSFNALISVAVFEIVLDFNILISIFKKYASADVHDVSVMVRPD